MLRSTDWWVMMFELVTVADLSPIVIQRGLFDIPVSEPVDCPDENPEIMGAETT